ncbi:MAG: CinA family protein [Bacteroidia bacterium]
MDRKVNRFIKKLQQRKLTVAFAESMTCGMAASKLASCIGTSDVLTGSIVCYSETVKCELFGISKKTVKKYSCESQQVTDALAKKLKMLIRANIYAAITGLAAEGGSETPDKPVGTVFFCVIFRRKMLRKRVLFRGTPKEVREKACFELYKLVEQVIE